MIAENLAGYCIQCKDYMPIYRAFYGFFHEKSEKSCFFRSFLTVRLGQLPQNERYKLISRVRSELTFMLYIRVEGL